MEQVMILALIFGWYHLSTSVSASQNRMLSVKGETGLEFKKCTGPWCENHSEYEIFTRFPGLFLTKMEFAKQQYRFKKSRSQYLRKQGVNDVDFILHRNGDGDSCCTTSFKTKLKFVLNNTIGEERAIVHLASSFPPSFQWISYGECVDSTGDISCGECVNEYAIRTLLVYDSNIDMFLFDEFELPAYCSCKRTFDYK